MAQLDILPVVPDTYNPASQIMAWADIVPNFTLPSDKIFVLGKGNEWNHEQLFAKGVTQIQHNDINGISGAVLQQLKDQGKTYHSVPITPELLGIGPSGPNEWVGNYPNNYNRLFFPNGLPSYQQGFEYGMNCDISHKVIVGETMENTHYTNPDSEFWAGYYDAKSLRMDARFGPGNWRMAHDYAFIRIGPDWHYISEQQAKDYFRNLPTLPGYGKLSGTLKHCNMYCSGVYLGMMDRDKRTVYGLALSGRMYKAINRYHVAFFDNERETRPNNKNAIKLSGGTLYRENKIPVPAALTAGVVISGLHFGDGFIPWNAGAKVTNKLLSSYWMQQLANGSFYVKDGETQQRNWQESTNLSGDQSYNFVQWSCNIDVASFAAYAYAATLGQVYGGVTKSARYKMGNGDWYNPVNTFQDDLCYAKYHSAPIVETVVRDGKEAILFMDPCSNNKRKTVTVQGQTGNQYTFEACGDMPHLAIRNV